MKKKTIKELNRISKSEFKKSKKNPIVVVLDNVRSSNNVGSIFRTCDAFRIKSLYLCGITPSPLNKEIYKTALGSTESVEWKKFSTTLEAILCLKNNGYYIISIEQTHNSIFLNNFDKKNHKKIAIILGNEVYGIEQEVINNSDLCLEIPQYGIKHSLNVSVCAGIILYNFVIPINRD